jgi:hypothetical protein
MMRSWRLAGLIFALAATACQPLKFDDPPLTERNMVVGLTGVVCAAASSNHFPPCCGPDDKDRPFELAQECQDSPVRAYIEQSAEAARAAGLSYDGYCMYEIVGSGWNRCVDFGSGTLLDCEEDCQIYHGELGEGENCEAYGHRMSDCRQGLICAPDRRCHQPCDYSFVAPEGGYCGPSRGMWFVTCGVGLACNSHGICEAAAATGEACDADTACRLGGWCEPVDGICVPGLPGGSPCTDHEQCSSDVCKAGVCFTPESPVCGRWAW